MAKTVKVSKRQPTKLRKSLTPGTVVIQLAGRFRGKRAVFLKQLDSGLLLVTGPHKCNGVPLRRVNQKYVIATSTKVDVKAVNAKSITDKLFAREKAKKDKDEVFAAKEAKTLSAERKKSQADVDKGLEAVLKKDPMIAKYLKARFSLSSGMKPHEMSF